MPEALLCDVLAFCMYTILSVVLCQAKLIFFLQRSVNEYTNFFL